MSRLLPTTLPLILFILAPADTFYTREEEQEWVASILNQTTNHTPHSNMLNNTVFICLDLYQLLGIDEKEGTVNIKLWLYITYYLPHIVWDPATNGQYFMPPNTVWAPDIVSYDATEVVFDVFNRQLISFDGIVVASSTTVNVKVTCSISVRHFPFDTQVKDHKIDLKFLISSFNSIDFNSIQNKILTIWLIILNFIPKRTARLLKISERNYKRK